AEGSAFGGRRAEAGIALPRAERVERLWGSSPLDAVRDVFRECGPVLEAVARAAAEQPPVVALRVPVEEEVRVRRQVVLADARADERRTGERRKAAPEVAARELLALRLRDPLDRVRIDLLARAVPGDLEAEAAELAVAVVRAGVLAEARRPGPRAVDADEEDVPAGDPLLDELREQRGQPRSARPHDDVGVRRVARGRPRRLDGQSTREQACRRARV